MPNSRGFTVMELMTSLIVTAVFVVAAGSADQCWQRVQIRLAMSHLASALASARLQAMTYHMSLIVCPSDNQSTCAPHGDWSHGWLTRPAGHAATGPAPPGYGERFNRSVTVLAGPTHHQLHFFANGRTFGSNLRLRFCKHQQLYGTLIVNNLGRIRATHQITPASCHMLPHASTVPKTKMAAIGDH